MTIAAAYLTSEGVVLGADSATTVAATVQEGAGAEVVQLLNHAQKVFEVGQPKRSRIALCTYGFGLLGDTSHRTIAARLADRVDNEKTTIEEAAKILSEVVQPLISHIPEGQSVGYFVGGHDPETHDPACSQVLFQAGKSAHVESMPIGEVRFAGAPDVFHRIFRGYDQHLPRVLGEELRRAMPDLPDMFGDEFARVFESVSAQFVAIGTKDIPIREAIDYVDTYVRITIKAFKFRYGPPLCGGPVEIGFVTTDRPFRWARHKPFTSAVQEQDQ
jgi:hypothetical protein